MSFGSFVVLSSHGQYRECFKILVASVKSILMLNLQATTNIKMISIFLISLQETISVYIDITMLWNSHIWLVKALVLSPYCFQSTSLLKCIKNVLMTISSANKG